MLCYIVLAKELNPKETRVQGKAWGEQAEWSTQNRIIALESDIEADLNLIFRVLRAHPLLYIWKLTHCDIIIQLHCRRKMYRAVQKTSQTYPVSRSLSSHLSRHDFHQVTSIPNKPDKDMDKPQNPKDKTGSVHRFHHLLFIFLNLIQVDYWIVRLVWND